MKFSERGQRNFYDHFHFLDGTIEDFVFKGSDIEGGVVILSVEEATFIKSALNSMRIRHYNKGEFDKSDKCSEIIQTLKEQIEESV